MANCHQMMRKASHLLVSGGSHHRAEALLAVGSAAVGDCQMYRGTRLRGYDKKGLPGALRQRQTLRLHRARNVKEYPSVSGAPATIH